MSEIDQLESRITAALDRIRAGVGQMSEAVAKAAEPKPEVEDETAALRYQLQEEQNVTSRLEERVSVLRERQDGNVAEMKARAEAQTHKITALEAKIQELSLSNAELTASNETLRNAAQDTNGSPELMNRAAVEEIEALTAQRAIDATEIDAIISELKPLIEKA